MAISRRLSKMSSVVVANGAVGGQADGDAGFAQGADGRQAHA